MDNLLFIYLGIVLVTAAAMDLYNQRIPNLLTFTAAIFAIAAHTIGNGLEGFSFSVFGFALGIGLLIIPYLLGGMGAGDAKLLGAAGAIIGARSIFNAFLISALCGGLYSLLIISLKRKYFRGFFKDQLITLQTLFLTRRFIPTPIVKNQGRPRLCYGVAIALGTFIYMGLKLSGQNFDVIYLLLNK